MTAPSSTFYAEMASYGFDRLAERLSGVSCTNGECIEADLGCTVRGYGRLKVRRKYYLAHRVAWTVANRRDPGALQVCHTCDNRRCVNPKHLWLGTNKENYLDMVAKGRRGAQPVRRRSRGFKLSADDVVAIRADARPSRLLAQEFGVARETIAAIRSGRAWPHIPPALVHEADNDR